MALIELPTYPAPRQLKWRIRDFGSVIRGGLGSPDQRRNGLGNRLILTVVLPAMELEVARLWAARLNQGIEADGVSYWVREIGLEPGYPGEPRVNGAGQSGKTLTLDGLRPRYQAGIGQFLSITTNGTQYGLKLAQPLLADETGAATITFEPALRAEPADDDVIEIGKPLITGFLPGAPEAITDVSPLVEGFEFSIEEAE